MKNYIYGLFNRRGVCEYVGQTINPTDRARTHKRTFGEKLKFKTLDGQNSEVEAIAEFRNRGEAKLNRRSIPQIERVNVGMEKPLHLEFSGVASLLQMDLQSAQEQAVRQWIERNRERARKAAKKLGL